MMGLQNAVTELCSCLDRGHGPPASWIDAYLEGDGRFERAWSASVDPAAVAKLCLFAYGAGAFVPLSRYLLDALSTLPSSHRDDSEIRFGMSCLDEFETTGSLSAERLDRLNTPPSNHAYHVLLAVYPAFVQCRRGVASRWEVDNIARRLLDVACVDPRRDWRADMLAVLRSSVACPAIAALVARAAEMEAR